MYIKIYPLLKYAGKSVIPGEWNGLESEGFWPPYRYLKCLSVIHSYQILGVFVLVTDFLVLGGFPKAMMMIMITFPLPILFGFFQIHFSPV